MGNLDLTKIEELIALMRRSGVVQLSVELPDCKVSIRRGVELTETPHAAETNAGPAAVAVPTVNEDPSGANPLTVIAPVVGLFHNGGTAPDRVLIEEGGRVRRGQLLAAIEAMKVPNEVRSPSDGVVASVAVEDGSAVEYGQTLFLILPEEGGETDEGEKTIGMA
jgi:acetyl-CoA carboxylase biotin carboxyl carrier protein